MWGTSKPGPSVLPGWRICDRCGIEFQPHGRLRADAPCKDCRDTLPKPRGGWGTEKGKKK